MIKNKNIAICLIFTYSWKKVFIDNIANNKNIQVVFIFLLTYFFINFI